MSEGARRVRATSAATPDMAGSDRPIDRRVVTAGAVGSIIECYEFGIYGYLSALLAVPAQIVLGIPGSALMAAAFSTFAGMLPARVRFSGTALIALATTFSLRESAGTSLRTS